MRSRRKSAYAAAAVAYARAHAAARAARAAKAAALAAYAASCPTRPHWEATPAAFADAYAIYAAVFRDAYAANDTVIDAACDAAYAAYVRELDAHSRVITDVNAANVDDFDAYSSVVAAVKAAVSHIVDNRWSTSDRIATKIASSDVDAKHGDLVDALADAGRAYQRAVDSEDWAAAAAAIPARDAAKADSDDAVDAARHAVHMRSPIYWVAGAQRADYLSVFDAAYDVFVGVLRAADATSRTAKRAARAEYDANIRLSGNTNRAAFEAAILTDCGVTAALVNAARQATYYAALEAAHDAERADIASRHQYLR